MGATGVATVLAFGFATSPVPPILAAALAVLAGIFSVARLRPSIRNPTAPETNAAQPGGHGDVTAA
jgi:DHA2 family multidrug resistance protein-like MFS transporter